MLNIPIISTDYPDQTPLSPQEICDCAQLSRDTSDPPAEGERRDPLHQLHLRRRQGHPGGRQRYVHPGIVHCMKNYQVYATASIADFIRFKYN